MMIRTFDPNNSSTMSTTREVNLWSHHLSFLWGPPCLLAKWVEWWHRQMGKLVADWRQKNLATHIALHAYQLACSQKLSKSQLQSHSQLTTSIVSEHTVWSFFDHRKLHYYFLWVKIIRLSHLNKANLYEWFGLGKKICFYFF